MASLNTNYKYACLIKEGKAGGQFLYCLEDDKFYHYKNGWWEALFDVEFLGRAQENLPEILKYGITARKQIVENFKSLGRKSLGEFNWAELINLKNGMISPYNGELLEHDDRYYSTNRLPYEYGIEALCPLWLKTLSEIFEDDIQRINLLQEFFGYCLTRDTKQHKALLLLGESRSGKSTILNVLRNMVGIKNCSSVPLKYIANPQYTPMLINKLVNIDTDVSVKAVEFEAEFKTITSGEPVQTNQKFIATFDFVPYCKLVMAANIFPKITDHSSAFYNRLILIPCDRVFSYAEQNRELPMQLIKELPGILNWAMDGLKQLHKRGKFEELDFMKKAVEELENENNPCNIFFDEHIEILVGENIYIEKGELYQKYKDWSEKTKNYPLSQNRFSTVVLKKFHKQTPKHARLDTSGKRVWKNLKWVENKGESITWGNE